MKFETHMFVKYAIHVEEQRKSVSEYIGLKNCNWSLQKDLIANHDPIFYWLEEMA